MIRCISLRTLMFTLMGLSVVACDVGPQGPWDFSSIAKIRVFVQNQTMEAFTVGDGPTVEVGAREYLGIAHGYFSEASKPEPPFNSSFDISRVGRYLARVTFRVLRYSPDGGLQDVTLVVTEGSPDLFAASTVDTEWITVVAVQHV